MYNCWNGEFKRTAGLRTHYMKWKTTDDGKMYFTFNVPGFNKDTIKGYTEDEDIVIDMAGKKESILNVEKVELVRGTVIDGVLTIYAQKPKKYKNEVEIT